MKEIKLSPNISPHDMGYRIEQANKFLSKGIQVKVTLNFKGRERLFVAKGYATITSFVAQCNGKPAGQFKLIEGKRQFITVTLNPVK